jgi:hypothetical protein
MIARIWHGWTLPENADAYEAMIKEEIFDGIRSRKIGGLIDLRLLRRDIGGEVEFITIMNFESMDAVQEFAGEDYERSVVYPDAKRLFTRYDDRSQHYKVLV